MTEHKAEEADFGQALVDAVRDRIKREALDRFTSDYLAEDAREWLAGFAARAAIAEISEQHSGARPEIAEVLYEHWDITGMADDFRCECGYGLGDGTGDLDGRHRAHVAEEITKEVWHDRLAECSHP